MSFQTEIKMGDEVRIKGARLFPMAKIVRSNFGGQGIFAWNRPNAVFVKNDSGEEYVLEIRDVTREAQVAILAAGAMASFIMWIFFRPRRKVTEQTGSEDR